MTTEELLSKLRAEVERIKKSYDVYLARVTKEDILNDLDNILSFLDTLENEDKYRLNMTREEAIKIIESNCSCSDSKLREACAMFIPELKESEDEWIRKHIIKILDNLAPCHWDGNEKTRCIAYLEKQKEPELLNNDEYHTVKVEILDRLYAHEKELEQLKKKQKPIDKCRGCNNVNGCVTCVDGSQWAHCEESAEKQRITVLTPLESVICRGFLFAGVEDIPLTVIKEIAKDCSALMKPAEWSDSVAKEMFIKALERAVEQTKKGYELTDCDKHSWWEDFKAYSGINPAEWSEEDEACSKLILQELEQDKEDSPDYSRHFTRLIDWFTSRLKSLRPQPHWKPSEEQMEVLFTASERNDKLGAILNSLYHDLKKL